MSRFSIFLAAFLFITMNSCESSKAADFKKLLDRSERKAFEIILGKEGSGQKKLNCLEKDDYKGAIAAVDQQAEEFDILIADIKKHPVTGIPEAEPLKTASLEYYKSLKELHGFDRKEIEQQALLQTLKDKALNNANNELIKLGRQKKLLYNAVYEKENILHNAAEKFNAVNGF